MSGKVQNMNSIEELAFLVSSTLAKNTECFIAQWVLQNPYKQMSDYTFCVQNFWGEGRVEYSMRLNGGFK